MFDVGMVNYFGSPRAQNIQSLPYTCVQRQLNASSIYMYFLPNENYAFQIWEIWINRNQRKHWSFLLDLSTVYDRFYIDYLKFALCKRVCINYSYPCQAMLKQS